MRFIARVKALAWTGVPSLKRKPLRSVNVYVLPSGEMRGGPVATSDRGAHVVASRAPDAAVYERAGSSESKSAPRRAMRTVPPNRPFGVEPSAPPSSRTLRRRKTASTAMPRAAAVTER
jgi:hypothetical protein